MRQRSANGPLQATFEQADARDLDTGQMTPEAPRLIGDLSWTYQKLPFHLQAKGEFEYVGRKVVGNGCDESNPNDLKNLPGRRRKTLRPVAESWAPFGRLQLPLEYEVLTGQQLKVITSPEMQVTCI